MTRLSQLEKCQYTLFVLYFAFPFWFNLIVSKLPMAVLIAHIMLLLPSIWILLLRRNRLSQYIDVLLLYLVVFIIFFLKFVSDTNMEGWFIQQTYSVYRFMLYPGSGIFAYAVIRLCSNKRIVFNSIKIVGYLLFLYYLIQSIEVIQSGYFVYQIFGEERMSKYNIAFGYGMLMAVVFLTIEYVRSKKIYILTLIVFGLIEILSFGSRAPIVMYLIFVIMLMVLYSGYDSKSKTQRKRLMGISILSLIIIWLFYFDGLSFIANILSRFGIESRTLISFFEGTISDDNGRGRIWEKVIELIREKPFLGHGVFGERNDVYAIGMKWGYAHNIFLEIMVDFGVLIGGLIIFLIIKVSLSILLKPKDKDYQLIFIGFFAVSMELLLSNSFWFHTCFWSLIGIYTNYKNETGRQRIVIRRFMER